MPFGSLYLAYHISFCIFHFHHDNLLSFRYHRADLVLGISDTDGVKVLAVCNYLCRVSCNICEENRRLILSLLACLKERT